MCDYSLQYVHSRAAKVGDKLITRDFGTGTRGFAAAEDAGVAVCVRPGTELAFPSPVTISNNRFLMNWRMRTIQHATAIFRQVNQDNPSTHHDALEFPDGQVAMLTDLTADQQATVLQLPAQPATEAEAKSQTRIAYVG